MGATPIVTRPGFVIIGIQVRTINRDEMDPATARIPGLWARWENVAADMPGLKEEALYAVYSDYESDHEGRYSLTLGYEVSPETTTPPDMARVVVPPGRYAVITSRRGPMPTVVVEAWLQIWGASEAELGGRRAFRVDYEVYDERSRDPADAQVEINLGLR
jgi:predicted transcriptional regulator YdeE